jgi:DNA-binding MarR family transcriptional regulator
VVTPIDILESLLISSHRLTHVAAQSTGNKTPSSLWRTLSILHADGAMRIGELAAASRISQPAITKLLPSLVEQELVFRIADVEDSRAWLIAISDKGRAALEDWRRELALALHPMFGDVSEEEWSVLASATEILQSRLRTAVAA